MSEVIGTVGSKVGTPWELVKSCPAANRTNPQEEESVAADLLVGTVARLICCYGDFFFHCADRLLYFAAFHKFPNLLVILTQLSLKTDP